MAKGTRRREGEGPSEPDVAKAPAVSDEFAYDPVRYRYDVLVPGYGSVLFVVLGVALLFSGDLFPADVRPLVGIAAVVMVIGGLYTAQRTFMGHAYPRVVRIDERELAFESFGRVDAFDIAGLTRCAVREGAGGRLYVRLEGVAPGGAPARGKYFVNCGDMRGAAGTDGREVQRFLCAQEARLDPDNLRVRARAINDGK